MLSPNKYEHEYVFTMPVMTARKRALQLLNTQKPEHPPDIYYIRRNDKLLAKYLDKDEFDILIK
jgi:tRNA nucleotidyltransferase (CCA-adding enzyme)